MIHKELKAKPYVIKILLLISNHLSTAEVGPMFGLTVGNIFQLYFVYLKNVAVGDRDKTCRHIASKES